MTKFLDGPARGQILALKRAPFFLRVSQKPRPVQFGKEWDALDQLEDEPWPEETLFVYELAAFTGMAHVRRTGGGGWYPIAEYRICPVQPADSEMRTTAAWHAWTAAHADRAMAIKVRCEPIKP